MILNISDIGCNYNISKIETYFKMKITKTSLSQNVYYVLKKNRLCLQKIFYIFIFIKITRYFRFQSLSFILLFTYNNSCIKKYYNHINTIKKIYKLLKDIFFFCFFF